MLLGGPCRPTAGDMQCYFYLYGKSFMAFSAPFTTNLTHAPSRAGNGEFTIVFI